MSGRLPSPPGASLRSRREELGKTLAAVASATRIPLEHLRAIEDDRFADLPAGPYAAAYVAALEEHLDTTVSATPPPAPPPLAIPLRGVRWIAATALVAMLAAIAWQIATDRGEAVPTILAPPAPPAPDQQVVIVTRRTVEVAVRVDGEETLRRTVPGGETLTFEAFDRIEVDLPAVDAVRVEHNGASIVPQGRQDHPRTLVFADDAGAGA